MNKSILILLVMIIIGTPTKAQTGILLVHYGTMNDASRKNTLEVMDSLVCRRFGQYPVETAYLAQGVIRNLEERGLYRQTVCEAMSRLVRKGCKRIIIQSTLLLDGTMVASLKEDADLFRFKVKEIVYGKPLITTMDDVEEILSIIDTKVHHDKDEQIVLVGHGTQDAANAMYFQIEHAARRGKRNMHVGTIESAPSIDDVTESLKERGKKNIVLVPLLYIAGNHQKNDIDRVWKTHFEKSGFNVRIEQNGLGSYAEIQERIISNISTMLKED